MDYYDIAREQVLDLIDVKNTLENELRALMEILKTNNVDMRSELVDEQGYPRADIDVYQVRHARQRIICLKNDLRSLIRKIDNGLAKVHSMKAAACTVEPIANSIASLSTSASGNHADSVPLNPFALVTLVDNGSPADIAGLCKGDRIIQFGSITRTNFTRMEGIFSVVTNSVGQPINVQVMRGSLVVGVTLVPRPWANRGLLGCHIQKLD